MPKPQQAGCHLFTTLVNKPSPLRFGQALPLFAIGLKISFFRLPWSFAGWLSLLLIYDFQKTRRIDRLAWMMRWHGIQSGLESNR